MSNYKDADIEKTLDCELREMRLKQQSWEVQCNGQASRPLNDAETLVELFKYHAPTDETIPKFAAINQAAKNFAEIVIQNCPRSADRSAAIRQIREARMTANAAIALNGIGL